MILRGVNDRAILLWTCTALFLVRVIGQIEVLLIAPDWLPPMEAWYSGLLPYPLLLPAQILILMLMCALNLRVNAEPHTANAKWRWWVSGFALVYCAAMLLRLPIQLLRGASDVIAAGGVPVAFHCVLALYLKALARNQAAPASRYPNDRSTSSSSFGSTGLVM